MGRMSRSGLKSRSSGSDGTADVGADLNCGREGTAEGGPLNIDCAGDGCAGDGKAFVLNCGSGGGAGKEGGRTNSVTSRGVIGVGGMKSAVDARRVI